MNSRRRDSNLLRGKMAIEHKNILTLIAATIFSNKLVYESSYIDAFIKATDKLKIAKKLDPQISEEHLLSWYAQNKDDIRQKLDTPYFKEWFYGLLEQFRYVPEQDKESIVDIMRKISIADRNVHDDNEGTLTALAERYWRFI